MELKEYIQIVRKHKNLFWGIWLGTVILGLLIFVFQPTSHQAIMSLDIARTGAEKQADEFQFDQYYRINADEKFGKTVVQWLKDPGVVNAVVAEKKLSPEAAKNVGGTLKAEQLAPNYIQIKFVVDDPDEAKIVSDSIERVIVGKVESLNVDSKDNDWFKVIVSAPVVVQKQLPFFPILIGAIALGFLLAVFGVMMKHYLE